MKFSTNRKNFATRENHSLSKETVQRLQWNFSLTETEIKI
jgi:hypothetical protein